jgi:hypothetical protein
MGAIIVYIVMPKWVLQDRNFSSAKKIWEVLMVFDYLHKYL